MTAPWYDKKARAAENERRDVEHTAHLAKQAKRADVDGTVVTVAGRVRFDFGEWGANEAVRFAGLVRGHPSLDITVQDPPT